jgi:hypothetical protein
MLGAKGLAALKRFLVTCAASFFTLSPALAQAPPADIPLLVGFGVGTVSDLYARLIARHLGRHLPGKPHVQVRNVPGSAGRVLAGQLAGTRGGPPVIAMLNPAILLDEAVGQPLMGVDSTVFKWIGSPAGDANVVWAWANRGPADLAALKSSEFVVGATRAGSPLTYTPKLLNALIGTRMRVVNGYAGGSELDDRSYGAEGGLGSPLKYLPGGAWFELNHAVESGEVDGFAGMSLRQLRRGSNWLATGKAVPLIQLGLGRAEGLADVPLASELATDEVGREIFELVSLVPAIGRPLAMASDTPDETLAAVRLAFDEVFGDIALQFEALESNLDLAPITGQRVGELVARANALAVARGPMIREALR